MQTPSTSQSLAHQAAALLIQAFGNHPGFRLAHAKGIVCRGTFTPATAAADLSRAAHFRSGRIPVLVRFSDSTGVPTIPDNDPNSNPKGMAIRFELPGGVSTDIVSNGLNGFVVGTPIDFVGLFSAIVATKPDSPKPTPLDQFLASHPASAAYLSQPNPTPASFATQAFFGNNAFVFINARGQKQTGRYQIVPLAGQQYLSAQAAAAQSPDFLVEEIKERLGKGPVEFRLLVQVADQTDSTVDATEVWPEDRRKVELGIVQLTIVDSHSAETERALVMDPTHLVDGIELSDDPLPAFRSQVYGISFDHRR
jgi:catalase